MEISKSQVVGVGRGITSSEPTREVLTGIVQRLSLMGIGGEAPPSGNWLILNKPVVVDGVKCDRVYLGLADLKVGGQYTVSGELSLVRKRGVETTVTYASLTNVQPFEACP
jgi:hypothetical protein